MALAQLADWRLGLVRIGLRKDTERVLARAQNFVGRVLLDAVPAPSSVLVDGVPVEVRRGQPLVLRVGDHLIELRAEGFARERRRVSLKGGEEQVLRVVFTKPGAPRGEPNKDEVAPPSAATRHWYKSPWLWTAVGVVAAGAAVGTGFALAADDSRPKGFDSP